MDVITAQNLADGPTAMANYPSKIDVTSSTPNIMLPDTSVIDTVIHNWKAVVHAQIDGYQGERSLICQQYKVPCDYETFCTDFLNERLSSTR